MARLGWIAGACTALGGGLLAAYVGSEAPHAADMREITANLAWAMAALVLLEVLGLIRDWAIAWVAAVPLGLLTLVVASVVPAHANYNSFADSPVGLLMVLGALGLLACVLARFVAAVPTGRGAAPPP